MTQDFLAHLREVNSARAAAWFVGETTHSFRALFNANEYAGEGGEVCNEVKKLVREAEGWKGSRTTTEKLANEIADAIICLDKIAADYGIDIAAAVVAKFNATSLANSFPHMLAEPASATELVEAATKARDQFDFYAREHSAAGKEEKADTNQRFADMLSAALGAGR